MKRTKYKGVFIYHGFEKEPLHFQLEVNAFNFTEAFILLTAKAIQEGKSYQLESIQDEDGNKSKVKKLDLIEIFDLRH